MQFNSRCISLSIMILLMAMSVAGYGKNEAGEPDFFHYPEMVRVPAGTFMMGLGSPLTGTGPEHLVTISDDYEIGKYEVCNREYCDMLNYALGKGQLAGNYANSQPVRNKEGQSQRLLMLGENIEGIASEIRFDKATSLFVVEKGKERRPVVYVTWYGAAFYCNMISEKQGLTKMYNLSNWEVDLNPGGPGYRIPTEAEWEYAVRFDESTNVAVRCRSIPWGWPWPLGLRQPETVELQKYANFDYASGKGGTKDVGSYENGKSKLGLYDMTGNVSEWNQDFLAVYKSHAQTNPVEISSGCYRQRRGGGWLHYANNTPWTTYHMDCNYAFVYYVDLGFRVVKTRAKLNPITDLPVKGTSPN